MKYFSPVLSSLLILTLLALGAACGDPDPEAQQPDAGPADQDASDASDVGDDADVDPDECLLPPSPTLGDTPLAAEWAEDASYCGQPQFALLDDPSMGDVVNFGTQRIITAGELNTLAEQFDEVTLPRELKYDSQVRVFTYLTQDRGEIIEATALMAYPITDDDPEFEPTAPVLSLHGTTGFSDHCAPSSMLEAQLLAAVLASMGHTVVAPDFIGLKSMGDPTGFLHPYLVGQPTAIASLDSLRALYKMPEDKRGGHCYPHEYLSFGGSQGGHAALWIDRLSTTYAPEFEPLGAVATVPPADLATQATKALQEMINATGNTIAFFGTAASWYGVEDRLDEVFNEPLDTLIPEVFAEGCSFGAITDDYEELEDVFTPEFLEQVATGQGVPEPWRCMIEHNGLVTTDVERHGPFPESYGVQFILGEDDELVDTPIERDSFAALCEQGMPLSYLECAGGPHGATTAWAMPEFLDYLDERAQRLPLSADELCVLDAPVVCQGTPDE